MTSLRGLVLCQSAERVLEFEIPDQVRQKYIEKFGLTQQVALEHERELKRYLAMCLSDPASDYGMAGPVDELWHTFIVFTREYAHFCAKTAGEFIHHQPTSAEAKARAMANLESNSYLRFLEDYVLYYDELPPIECWPRGFDHHHLTAECGKSACSTPPGSCSPGNCGPSCGPNVPSTLS